MAIQNWIDYHTNVLTTEMPLADALEVISEIKTLANGKSDLVVTSVNDKIRAAVSYLLYYLKDGVSAPPDLTKKITGAGTLYCESIRTSDFLLVDFLKTSKDSNFIILEQIDKIPQERANEIYLKVKREYPNLRVVLALTDHPTDLAIWHNLAVLIVNKKR